MGGSGFPAIKAPELKRLLIRKLGYREDPDSRRGGSHSWLESDEYPRIRWAFHPSREVSSIEVRKLLIGQIGLNEKDALEVVR